MGYNINSETVKENNMTDLCFKRN